ncbi:hypothetical protein [Noviherbaspirillum cavernae]|uniref:hypothetical protein n=1 Tax=Noviherbaspirillum cavernae TaxID=2320862 RepID=UPI0011C390CE|nr:hypothetical protein [Noviherbaspirillum cavernae]
MNTLFLPLNQNDALEYATVGRLLFETKSLASYPAIHPEQIASGFYAPWTHPPLYVALIYVAEAIQGHANEPGLMRLIAPWFAIASTWLIFASGNVINRLCGFLAALIFISTPLFFLGADSAAIDALPVLGFALLMVVIVGVDAPPRISGAIAGLALGLALWTHAQAVLFVPLGVAAISLRYGYTNLRSILVASTTMLIVGLMIGGAPYIHNFLLFGSPISDNPAVFTMPKLEWTEYFAFSRGLDNWMAVIQYGIFKGWFALEAYGWSFWLMSLGLIAVARCVDIRMVRQAIQGGTDGLEKPLAQLCLCAGVVLVYLFGLVISVALGVDLMIKNERYMLVILPLVSILGGFGCYRLFRKAALIIVNTEQLAWKRDLLFVGAILISWACVLQLGLLGWHYRWRYIPDSNEIVQTGSVTTMTHDRETGSTRFQQILDSFLNIRVMHWVALEVPREAVILSLRPADMYYSHRRMVSYLDPRMLAVYREDDPVKAASLLRGLGIQYIHVPDYGLPVLYNTVLDQIVADPKLTRLAYSAGGTQLYKLEDSGQRFVELRNFTTDENVWTQWPQTQWGGYRVFGAIGVVPVEVASHEVSVTNWRIPFFHRDFSTMMATGFGTPFAHAKNGTLLPVVGGGEYRIGLDLQGRGYIRIWVAQFGSRGNLLRDFDRQSADRLGEVVLGADNQLKKFRRRLLVLPEAKYIRIGVERLGHSELTIKNSELSILKPAGADHSNYSLFERGVSASDR